MDDDIIWHGTLFTPFSDHNIQTLLPIYLIVFQFTVEVRDKADPLVPISSQWPLGVTVFLRPEDVEHKYLNQIPSDHTCGGKGFASITIFDEEVADFTPPTQSKYSY